MTEEHKTDPQARASTDEHSWGLRDIIIGAIAIAGIFVLIAALSGTRKQRRTTRRRQVDQRKKVFISFAAEEAWARDHLRGQANNEQSPFDFVDMSLQEPFDRAWKTQCRERIRGCDGMIAMLSKKTWRAKGARWEMLCAREEGVPVMGMHIYKDNKGAIPPELRGCRVVEWKWANLQDFVESL